jgi:hypothetical protein
MAAIYEGAVRSASVTAAARLAEFRTGSFRAYIREIGVSVGVAGAAPTVGLIRPNAIGVTPGGATTPAGIDSNNPAASTSVATSWGTAPTLAGTPVYLRRITLPATLGAGWVWAWNPGEELIVPINSSFLVDLIALSAATATAVDVYIKYVE